MVKLCSEPVETRSPLSAIRSMKKASDRFKSGFQRSAGLIEAENMYQQDGSQKIRIVFHRVRVKQRGVVIKAEFGRV